MKSFRRTPSHLGLPQAGCLRLRQPAWKSRRRRRGGGAQAGRRRCAGFLQARARVEGGRSPRPGARQAPGRRPQDILAAGRKFLRQSEVLGDLTENCGGGRPSPGGTGDLTENGGGRRDRRPQGKHTEGGGLLFRGRSICTFCMTVLSAYDIA